MKKHDLVAALLATALLASCRSETGNDAAPANEAANAAEPAPSNTTANAATPAAAPAADGALNAAFMAGKWSAIDEDCSDTLEFKPDGTVMTPIGPGKWTLVGDQLGFEFEGQKMDPSTVRILSPDRIEITKKSGKKETQRRC